MKCSHYQERIYLFDELNADEKRGVLAHIASCHACRQCYHRMRQDRAIVKAAFTTPAMEEARLTARIMEGIGHRRSDRVSLKDHLLHFLHDTPMRYALGTLSGFMIIFFCIEFLRSPGHDPGAVMLPDATLPKTVALNETFYRELKPDPNNDGYPWGGNTLSLYTCIQACQAPAGPDCADCKIKYAKLKHHEDI